MRLTRRLESIPNPRNPVLVYGPVKFPHQISFIPALMSDDELKEARRLSSAKTWSPPWQIMSVGRLVPEKGFDLAIHGLAELSRSHPDLDWQFTLIGEGYARKSLEALSVECGIASRVVFPGALSFTMVQQHYAKSHLVIMPGVKEGWAKVIAEAWAHGAIPVAAIGGIVPHIIRDENAGVIFQANPKTLAEALAGQLGSPERMEKVANHVYRYCDELSLTQFKVRLERVLLERCGL
jgi:glycosyltransferase involved in cell wall biosynthesis